MRVLLLAAFISAWLYSYCVPIEQGAFIRPEVFMVAAASIAQGIRRSIRVASMAHLYSSLDNISCFMKESTNLASEYCELPLAMHFTKPEGISYVRHKLLWFLQLESGQSTT
jgi:hypothetical protein